MGPTKRENRRRDSGWTVTLGSLVRSALGVPPDTQDLAARWKISPHDNVAAVTLNSLRDRWVNWLHSERHTLLRGIEALAQSELSEASRNEKVDSKKDLNRAKLAAQAMRLALALREEESLAAQKLLVITAEYASITFDEMIRESPMYRRLFAREMAQSIKPLVRARSEPGRMTWVLIADLVWLAMHREGRKPTERQIRAYVDNASKAPKSAVHRLWDRNWPELVKMKTLLRQSGNRNDLK